MIACFLMLGAGGWAPASAAPERKAESPATWRAEARGSAVGKASVPRKPLVLDAVDDEARPSQPAAAAGASRVGRILAVTGGAALLLVALGRALRRRSRRAAG